MEIVQNLVEEAVFSLVLENIMIIKISIPSSEDLYYYMINGFHKPDFVIDVSALSKES